MRPTYVINMTHMMNHMQFVGPGFLSVAGPTVAQLEVFFSSDFL